MGWGSVQRGEGVGGDLNAQPKKSLSAAAGEVRGGKYDSALDFPRSLLAWESYLKHNLGGAVSKDG